MKKVARTTPTNEEGSNNPNGATPSPISNVETTAVRTTGRIKKPKAVFDPSDNYLPRAQQRSSSVATPQPSSSQERRASSTKSTNISPVGSIDSTATAKEASACVVCKKRESKRPIFANKNPLISCLGCEKKIHKGCLKVEFEDFEFLQNHFKCDQCSICKICQEKFDNPDEELITCSKCIKSFHIDCFPTKIIKTEINQRNWKCNKCQILNQITNGTTLPVKKIREIIGGVEPRAISPTKSIPTTSTKTSPISNVNNEDTAACTSSLRKRSHEGETKNESLKSNDSIDNATVEKCKKSLNDESTDDSLNNGDTPPTTKRTKTTNNQSADNDSHISSNTQSKPANHSFSPTEHVDDLPDVKDWSFDQVYEYFAKHFPKEAHVFKDEEIDGRSLLLLKRSDIVKKLPIKLGPSLRIYSLILKIQAQDNNPTLGWNCSL